MPPNADMGGNPFAHLPTRSGAAVHQVMPVEPMAPVPGYGFATDWLPRSSLEGFTRGSMPGSYHSGQPPPVGNTGTVPVPGWSSGYLPSGMNYDYLPMGTAVLAPQPFVSPLQQRLALGVDKATGPLAIGSPVRICNMTNSETKAFNGLVGDIVGVRKGKTNDDGAAEMVFDIRCPLRNTTNWWPKSIKDKDHCDTPVSVLAHNSVFNNRQILFGSQESMEKRMEFAGAREPGSAVRGPDSEVDETPYILVTSLTTEKFETLGGGNGQRANQQPFAPKWGTPVAAGSGPLSGLPPVYTNTPGGYHQSMQGGGNMSSLNLQWMQPGSMASLQSMPGSNVYHGPPRHPQGARMHHDGSIIGH